MATTAPLTENSRQGFEVQKPPCIGFEANLSRNPRRGCGHAYDETASDLAVYVRNDPVNYVDPDGRFHCAGWGCFYPGHTVIDINDQYPGSAGAEWGSTGGGSGGIQDITLIRQESVQNLVGNIADRIGDENSDCWKYLQGVIDKLHLSSLSSPADLVKHLNDATYDVMGDQHGDFLHGSPYFGQKAGIWAEVNTSWLAGTGPANKVTLGWNFFNSNTFDQGAVLIHEAFHLFSGTLVLGYGGLQDKDLIAAAGAKSTVEFNATINTKCPKK